MEETAVSFNAVAEQGRHSNAADGGPNIDKIEIAGRSSVARPKFVTKKPVFHYNNATLKISSVSSGVSINIKLFTLSNRKVLEWSGKNFTGYDAIIPLKDGPCRK